MAIYDMSGNSIPTGAIQTNEVLVASSDAGSDIKSSADYVCTGTNDELVIQQAINYLANKGGGILRLSKGYFHIDSFPNTDSGSDNVALLLPQATKAYHIEIKGALLQYGWEKESALSEGTTIEVSETCYTSLSSSDLYTVIRAGYVASLMNTPSKVSLAMENICFRVPSNQKKVTILDCLYINRLYLDMLKFRAYKVGFDGYSSGAPQVASEGCVAIRSMGGSNSGSPADIRHITVQGFYEGFKLGSEHIIGINLSAIYCVYGFTFGNYAWADMFVHPITLINCCDERNINLPLFVDCGKRTSYSASSTGGPQAITCIDFNIERVASETPGGTLGNLATEVTPGKFRGSIEFTMTNGQFNTNSTDAGFWADGSGHGFVTRNQAHELSGTSATRRGYKPSYMQSFFDTTVNKMLWCIDTANKTWVDAQGNTVA